MTRVLLAHQPTDGGVARHVRDLASGLSALGYEVVLCGPGLVGRDGADAAEYRRVRMARAISPVDDLTAARDVVGLIRELRPDIVHAHSSKAGAVARLARLVNPSVPLLYSPHLYAFAGYSESEGQRRLYRLLERTLAPLASRVVCVCEDEARLARAVGPAGRVRVVYNGIATVADGAVDARLTEMRARGPVVGTVALLHARKGVQTLIDATPAILSRHPRAQLAVFGDGPELEALRERARQRNVQDSVRFFGACSNPPAALRGIDVFAHPSWAESFPYVILEAMSAGSPIVATAVGGVPEAIIDGHSGALVPPREPALLAEAICALLDSPELRSTLAARASARVAERFSLTAMVGGLSAVYSELIGADAVRERVAW